MRSGQEELLEKEYKVLLSVDQYKKIEGMFRWQEVFTQTNYYYMDKENILSQKDVTVRIREKKNQFKLQTKVPFHNDENIVFTSKIEREMEMSGVPQLLSKRELAEVLPEEYQLQDVKRIGSLVTHRKVCQYGDCEISLDSNEYLGVVDYESEIEFTKFVSDELLQQLGDIGICFLSKSPGKNRRFLRRYSILN